jgi:hypothetical protein
VDMRILCIIPKLRRDFVTKFNEGSDQTKELSVLVNNAGYGGGGKGGLTNDGIEWYFQV